jgi:hypothetical protein
MHCLPAAEQWPAATFAPGSAVAFVDVAASRARVRRAEPVSVESAGEVVQEEGRAEEHRWQRDGRVRSEPAERPGGPASGPPALAVGPTPRGLTTGGGYWAVRPGNDPESRGTARRVERR